MFDTFREVFAEILRANSSVPFGVGEGRRVLEEERVASRQQYGNSLLDKIVL